MFFVPIPQLSYYMEIIILLCIIALVSPSIWSIWFLGQEVSPPVCLFSAWQNGAEISKGA